MNINTNNYNYYKRISPNNNPFGVDKLPLKKDINFTSSIARRATSVVSQQGGKTILSNAKEITSRIERILGKDFAQENIFNGKCISIADDNTLSYTSRTLKGDIVETARSIVGIPIRIIDFARRKLNISPESGDFITRWIETDKANLARNKAIDIIEQFAGNTKNGTKLKLDECQEKFMDSIGGNITKVKKNYLSRDERALNRVTTSTVSALYSGADFYNLSMIQKDDKEEAKKAQKARIGQELKRMAMSAGMTYVTLGALDRYTKKNIWLNAAVIAGSALFSEILSRILSGTSLIPLSPEAAAKVASKTKKGVKAKEENKKEIQNLPQQEGKKENVAFKANLTKEEKIFKNFAGQNGKINILNNIAITNAEKTQQIAPVKNKKKKSIVGTALSLFAGASAFYVISKSLKGDYSACASLKNVFKAYKDEEASIRKAFKGSEEQLDMLLEDLYLRTKIEIAAINEQHAQKAKRFSFMKKFKDAVTTRKTEIKLKDLYDKLASLQNDCSSDDSHILEIYEKHIINTLNPTIDRKFGQRASLNNETRTAIINLFKTGYNDADINTIASNTGLATDKIKTLISDITNTTISTKQDIPVMSGLYSGITKVFNTVYTILSSPAVLIDNIITKKQFEASNKFAKKCGTKDYKKELTELANLTILNRKNPTNAKIIEEITSRARNVEIGAETGDLANISRTMVTAISTYFFVNDYRNKVLIESEGKDIQGANEEMNDRIAHKLSNFVINGTLMNTFNSIFKVPLNGSLLGAATVAGATEITNEALVRKSICQPIRRKNSKQEIIDYEEAQLNKKGFMGWWARTFMKLTGKKNLTQKAGIKKTEQK